MNSHTATLAAAPSPEDIGGGSAPAVGMLVALVLVFAWLYDRYDDWKRRRTKRCIRVQLRADLAREFPDVSEAERERCVDYTCRRHFSEL